MHCGSCVSRVKGLLEAQNEVQEADVNLLTSSAVAHLLLQEQDNNSQSKDQIASKLAQILSEDGYDSTYQKQDEEYVPQIVSMYRENLHKLIESQKRVIVAAVLGLTCVLGHVVHHIKFFPPFISRFLCATPTHVTLSVAAMLGPARQLMKDGLVNLKNRKPDMNSLVAVGALSTFIVSTIALGLPQLKWRTFFEEPAMLLAAVLLGRSLEERAKLQASQDVTQLSSLLPDRARLLTDQNQLDNKQNNNGEIIQTNSQTQLYKEIAAAKVRIGDIIIVLPGDKIPVDGQVIKGVSSVNEASFTGEPMPQLKEIDSKVSAGTINCDGVLFVKSEKKASETAIAEIVRQVEQSQARSAPIQRYADQISGKLTVTIMGISVATLAFWTMCGPKLFPKLLNQGFAQGLLQGLQLASNVLVVACPCALGLATPTAVLIGTSIAAKKGILIRGGDILEETSKIQVVAFDKTGTLTIGQPQVQSFVIDTIQQDVNHSNNIQNGKQAKHIQTNKSQVDSNQKEAEQFWKIVSMVESQSTHPLAKAIIQYAEQYNFQNQDLQCYDTQNYPGQGVSSFLKSNNQLYKSVNNKKIYIGTEKWLQELKMDFSKIYQNQYQQQDRVKELGTKVYIAIDKQVKGYITFQDQIRANAKEIVAHLKQLGLNIYMLSGDNKQTALHVASEVGIPNQFVYSDIKPTDKQNIVKQLRSSGQKVLMVGDGINDTGSLVEANVGAAITGGVDVARSVADIVLGHGNLNQVIEALTISKITFNKIKQNLLWALTYNLIGIPTAAGVFLPKYQFTLTPSIAGIMMGFSSLAVMGNSLLLNWEVQRSLKKINLIVQKENTSYNSTNFRTSKKGDPSHNIVSV